MISSHKSQGFSRCSFFSLAVCYYIDILFHFSDSFVKKTMFTSVVHVVVDLLTCIWRLSCLLPSSQDSIFWRGGPLRFHPPSLCSPHPFSNWTNPLSQQEASQPIKILQVTNRGHGGVSWFVQPITSAGLLGPIIITAGFDGGRLTFILLI